MEWASVAPVIAAIISAGAATYAAWSAKQARASEAETSRLRELEQRLSSKKIETYENILSALGNMLTPEKLRPQQATGGKKQPDRDPLAAAVLGFMNHAIVYGSDEVLRAFSRFRLASSHQPPPGVLMRLVADFMLAIRRDLDGGRSTVTGVELLGMRVNDLYTQPHLLDALTDPFDDVCEREGWTPPWKADYPDAEITERTTGADPENMG